MKKPVLFAVISLCTCLFFQSCNNDDNDKPDPQLPTAFVIQTTVQPPGGTRTVFLNILSNLTDEVDLSDAFELQGAARVKTLNGKLYVFDSESVNVIRYAIDETNELIEEDRFSMAGLGVTSFNGVIGMVSEEYAVSAVNGINQFVVWNPSAMEIRGTIDYPASFPEVVRVGFNAAVSPEGKVFIGIGGIDFLDLSNEPGARVAIIDPVSQTIEVAFEEDVAQGTEGFFDANGDYYHSGDAIFGFGRYNATPPDTTMSVGRIRSGESSFDSSFNLRAESINPDNYADMRLLNGVGESYFVTLRDVTQAELNEDPEVRNSAGLRLYTGLTSDWEGIEISIPANKITGSMFPVAGEMYIDLNDPNQNGSTDFANEIYIITNNGLEYVNETVGFLENIIQVR